MIVVVVVVDLIANVVGAIAKLLLAFRAAVAASIGEIGTQITTILDAYRLAVATTLEAVLPIVGGKVAILATGIAEVGSRVGSAADAITAIVSD
jgi:hypothetical protein